MVTTYIDIDGTIADFDNWIIEKNSGFIENPEKIYETMILNYKTCFRESKVINKNLLTLVNKYILLTAIPSRNTIEKIIENKKLLVKTDEVIKQLKQNKIDWCFNNEIIKSLQQLIIVDKKSDKLNFCHENAILFDDDFKTISQWNKKGGLGILMHNKIKWRQNGIKF